MKGTDSRRTPLALAGRLLTDEDGGDLRESIAHTVERLAELEFARRFVPYVIAHGALADGTHSQSAFEDVAQVVARRLGTHNLHQLMEDLEKADDLPPNERTTEMDRLLWPFFFCGVHGGYLLGIAVGQQIGPDAFKGGAR